MDKAAWKLFSRGNRISSFKFQGPNSKIQPLTIDDRMKKSQFSVSVDRGGGAGFCSHPMN